MTIASPKGSVVSVGAAAESTVTNHPPSNTTTNNTTNNSHNSVRNVLFPILPTVVSSSSSSVAATASSSSTKTGTASTRKRRSIPSFAIPSTPPPITSTASSWWKMNAPYRYTSATGSASMTVPSASSSNSVTPPMSTSYLSHYKLYRTIYKFILCTTFLILVMFQFQSGQMTISTFTQSLLLSSSSSSSYDFFWDKDVTTDTTSGKISSESRINSNEDDDVSVSRKTIVHTGTNEERVIPSDDQIDIDENDDGADDGDEKDDTTDETPTVTVEQDGASSVKLEQPLSQNTPTVYRRPSEWKLFPRWNTTTGIPIQPLIEFIFGVALDNATTIETKTIRNMFPETLYVFDVTGVYTSYRIRQRTQKTFINDRVKPTETIMKLAHQKLIQHMKELQKLQQHSGSAASLLLLDGSNRTSIVTTTKAYKMQRHKMQKMEQKWVHLQRLIQEKGSFPFLAWYGDFTACNYRNWKRRISIANPNKNMMTVPTRTRRLSFKATNMNRALLDSEDDNDDDEQALQGDISRSTDTTYESIPLFTTCAQIKCNYAFPLPTYKTIQGSLASTFQWKKRMQEYHEEYPVPLEEKIPKLVWRGSLTGDIQNYTNIRWLLCKYVTEASADEKQYYDIGLTKIPPRHEKVPLNLTIVGDLIPGIFPMAAFQNYRAILDIDGNSWSSRFGSLLCYHSVILKVEPMYVDYFHYSTLIPNVHYVPVHYNLSNLYSQTLYVMDPNNQNDIQRIIRNANSWCQHNMVYSKIANDYLTIFDQYVEYLEIASTTSSSTNTLVNDDVNSVSHWTTIWNDYKQHYIFPNKELFNMVPLK